MTKIRMLVELDYDAEIMHSSDEQERDWFFRDILKGDRLILHSNEIGDEIGDVAVLKIIPDVAFQNGDDYIDFAVTRLEIQHTVSGAFAREQYNALKASQMPAEWRKEAPTVAGVYQAKEIANDGTYILWAQVAESDGLLVARTFGYEEEYQLSDFSEWLGPFPTMDASA